MIVSKPASNHIVYPENYAIELFVRAPVGLLLFEHISNELLVFF